MPKRADMTRQMVSLSEAIHWIAYDRLEGPTAEHLARFRAGAEKGAVGAAPWLRKTAEQIQENFEKTAHEELLVVLRDDDLRAEGRLSETQTQPWNAPNGPWGLHSGKLTSIPVEYWVGGHVNWGSSRLTYHKGEYIEVRLPLFFLHAIWPLPEDPPPIFEVPQGGTLPFAPTPYLELLNQAVERFWATGAPPVEKKEILVEWLMEQELGGEKLSRNLAESMATMIRPLEARTGGNRKWKGP